MRVKVLRALSALLELAARSAKGWEPALSTALGVGGLVAQTGCEASCLCCHGKVNSALPGASPLHYGNLPPDFLLLSGERGWGVMSLTA